MKSRFLSAISLMGVASLLIACASAATATPQSGQSATPLASTGEGPSTTLPNPATASTSNETYIYVSNMGNLEFFNAHKYGWKWAGQAIGVNTKYVGPAEYDMTAQVTAFDQAIAEKPAGIAVFAVEPVLKAEIDKAAEAGIPVVTVLGDIPDSKRIAYVGSNQHDLGYVGGQRIAQVLGGKGKVAVLSVPGTPMFDEREAGYRDAFKDYPDIQVVQVGDTKADTATAVKVAADILQRYPDLVGFVCTDSTGGIGAATAVQEAGKAGEVKVVSLDRNSDVLQLIQKGVITGTVAQDDAAMAFWALQTLYNYNHHQAPLTSDNAKAGVHTGPSIIYMSSNWVDQNNLQYFLEANKLYSQQ